MLIKRIIAKNFKTYLDLDLDISVEADKPIILIGGVNGGGKTTLFESIFGALYGLKLNTQKQFKELLNAGAHQNENARIILELHFSGRVLNEEQQYILSRTYALNPSGNPVENVKLNMNGTIFNYGTATPITQKANQEAQVNKIIKANLPQELSRYFLFDAMEAGNLLKEDQLNKVIKENIENVMGFNKFMQIGKNAESLYQTYTAQRLQVENEKREYLDLLEQRKKQEELKNKLQLQLQDGLNYSVANRDIYDNLKNGLNQDTTIKSRIDQTNLQIDNIQSKESIYRKELTDFINDIEVNVFIPKLIEGIKSEVNLIINAKNDKEDHENSNVQPQQVEAISRTILNYLKENSLILKDISIEELVDYVISKAKNSNAKDDYSFLEHSEVKALEKLLNTSSLNSFPHLNQMQSELNVSINQIATLNSQVEQMKAQITGRDYTLLKAFEDNELNIKKHETEIIDVSGEIAKIEKRIHQFDIQTSQEPDPKYDTLGRLKGLFDDIANKLLLVKKQQIELKMKQDLNKILAAYKNVIDRVELSENLSNLTFKIFHTSGNEIYLNHLNTASKQIVIQVLLKALHEFGDYDPPVMIDTVMGVLSEESRANVLEDYFPELSHQTILLSSDSEIRPKTDFAKIEPFVSKTYTLIRDVENQFTNIEPGYFGVK
jgi:DNA sulfur modification protein DndD